LAHPLETRYGLTADELLDALDRRFRARVTLEGAVAEVHVEKHLRALVGSVVVRFERHDIDGFADFSVWPTGSSAPLLLECKNVRDRDEAYRSGGEVVAFKVETQKTRAATSDPTSRLYGPDQFDVLAVCLGRKTGQWSDFMYARTRDLARHSVHATKLAVMQRVPLPGAEDLGVWCADLAAALRDS
jgi:hypothetical protein